VDEIEVRPIAAETVKPKVKPKEDEIEVRPGGENTGIGIGNELHVGAGVTIFGNNIKNRISHK
jgi:hypothetical protein